MKRRIPMSAHKLSDGLVRKAPLADRRLLILYLRIFRSNRSSSTLLFVVTYGYLAFPG